MSSPSNGSVDPIPKGYLLISPLEPLRPGDLLLDRNGTWRGPIPPLHCTIGSTPSDIRSWRAAGARPILIHCTSRYLPRVNPGADVVLEAGRLWHFLRDNSPLPPRQKVLEFEDGDWEKVQIIGNVQHGANPLWKTAERLLLSRWNQEHASEDVSATG